MYRLLVVGNGKLRYRHLWLQKRLKDAETQQLTVSTDHLAISTAIRWIKISESGGQISEEYRFLENQEDLNWESKKRQISYTIGPSFKLRYIFLETCHVVKNRSIQFLTKKSCILVEWKTQQKQRRKSQYAGRSIFILHSTEACWIVFLMREQSIKLIINM